MKSGVFMIIATVLFFADASASTLRERQQANLKAIAEKRLQQGRVQTWVDEYRWSVAHACLALNTRLDEANQYFAELEWCGMMRGLVVDTDVQVTDLLRTYYEFKDSGRLTPAAKERLVEMLAEWETPNRDRNRDADAYYEWPCEYTENHSLNIVVASYLIGDVFNREADSDLRRDLVERFLEDRAKWGWSEFNSTRYSMVTAKALVLLADFAPDDSVRLAAKMHLDLLALQFACRCVGYWRGVPCSRGGTMAGNNLRDSFVPLARLWFGDPDPDAEFKDAGFICHFLGTKYTPPETALALQADQEGRGRYVSTQVATHGPAKERVPVVVWVSPHVTMASAQGGGSYYDGLFASISFAESPALVITTDYKGGRNIFQHENVMVTFGEVRAHGDFKPVDKDNRTLYMVGNAYAGHIRLGSDCHVLMVADTDMYPNLESFDKAVSDLAPELDDGTVRLVMPDGGKVEMRNKIRDGQWELVQAAIDGRLIRVDRNLLFDSPYMRGVRGSKITEVRYDGRKWLYDMRDMREPVLKEVADALFAPVPDDIVKGPLGLELVYIPPSEFPMGSPLAEGRSRERPQRWVYVDGFRISKTEITAGQYKEFLKANPEAPRKPDWLREEWCETDEHAIVYVTWHEAEAFCRWLSTSTGHTYRLPTEAEWEKAAKGYSHRPYPWGYGYDGSQAGCRNEKRLPVNSKPMDVSPFGVVDMAGNVWEWCADWYDAKAYANAANRNPAGPENGEEKVLRGCGWNFDPDTFRTAYRSGLDPDTPAVHIGFRVVRGSGQ